MRQAGNKNDWARGKEYDGMGHYVRVSDLLNGRRYSGGKNQKAMERSIDVLDIGPCIRGGPSVEDLDWCMDLGWALGILTEIDYDNRGKIVYGQPNSSGERMVKVIKEIYYEGRTLEEIRKEMGMTREGVRQIKIRGIHCLRRILTKQGLGKFI
ncbi:MAG: sigma factor-like helix-turn-helix DNA-binding protein [archaeon]